MDEKTYTGFVASRAKPGEAILEMITASKLDLLHGAIGMSGEAGELVVAYSNDDHENMSEECGDIEFYLRQVQNNLCVTDEELFEASGRNLDPFKTLDEVERVVVATATFLDIVKKRVVYNKAIGRQEMLTNLGFVRSALGNFYRYHGGDVNTMRRINVEKLRKRYPDGYTDAAAQARADKEGAE